MRRRIAVRLCLAWLMAVTVVGVDPSTVRASAPSPSSVRASAPSPSTVRAFAPSPCPIQFTICNPAGLTVLAASDAMAGAGSTAAGASTLGAAAGTAGTGTVTGLTWQTVAGAGLFSAVVSAGGWYATDLLVDTSHEVTGLDMGTPAPGFGGAPGMSLYGTVGWVSPSVAFGAVTAPAYGATGAQSFSVPLSLSGTCSTFNPWAPVVTAFVYFTDGSHQQLGLNGPAWDGRWFNSFGDTCSATSGLATVPFTVPIGKAFSYVGLTNAGWTQWLPWYPLGHPNRPAEAPAGSGTITQTVLCVGAGGVTQTITAVTQGSMLPGSAWQLPDVLCPPGMVAASFGAEWTPATPGGQPQPVVPLTPTEDWVTRIPTDYPLCLTETCYLELHRIQPAPEITCGLLATDCPDWYIDPARAQNYQCTWGPYQVDLDRCSVFRDPGTLRPNAALNPDGTSTYLPWPPLELDSGPVARLTSQLLQRYSPTQSCEILGESIRSHEPAASVPDFVVVCEAHGVADGLAFTASTPGVASTQGLVDGLHDAASGPTPGVTYPDCEYLAEDGRCLDDEAFVGEDPALEPAPAGAGMVPPENCMPYSYWSQLIDSLPTQEHHILTNKNSGYWTPLFERIVGQYGLDLDGSWNRVDILHRGSHANRYHNWVMENLEAIDRVAQGDVTTFLALFDQWIKQPLEADPTILRAKYWECHPK